MFWPQPTRTRAPSPPGTEGSDENFPRIGEYLRLYLLCSTYYILARSFVSPRRAREVGVCAQVDKDLEPRSVFRAHQSRTRRSLDRSPARPCVCGTERAFRVVACFRRQRSWWEKFNREFWGLRLVYLWVYCGSWFFEGFKFNGGLVTCESSESFFTRYLLRLKFVSIRCIVIGNSKFGVFVDYANLLKFWTFR